MNDRRELTLKIKTKYNLLSISIENVFSKS